MDREKALAELPTAYAVALRMRGGGASDDAIAAALGVPAEAVRQFLEIAERKLKASMGRDQVSGEGEPGRR